jgi:hypothetical protein
LQKINKIASKHLREYYRCLYQLLNVYIIAYLTYGTKFNTSHAQTFLRSKASINIILTVQPIQSEIPVVSQFVDLPFNFLLKFFSKRGTAYLSLVANKLSAAWGRSKEENYKSLISVAIEHLIEYR